MSVFNESYVMIFSFLRNCLEGIPRAVEDLFLRGNVGETVYDPVPPVPEELSVGFLGINILLLKYNYENLSFKNVCKRGDLIAKGVNA